MKNPWSVLVVVTFALAGAAGCGDGPSSSSSSSEGTERFTQGGVSMEPAVRAGQVITARKVGAGYQPKRGDIVLFHGDPAHTGAAAPRRS